MKRMLIIAGLVAMAAMAGTSVRASLVESGLGTFTSMGSGTQNVSYFVDVSGGVYTYVYEFNSPTAPIGEYEVNVNVSYVSSVLASGNSTIALLANADLGAGSVFASASTTYSTASTGNPTQVQLIISPAATGSYAFGFTSPYGPINGSGSLIDGTSGPWGDNPGSGGAPIPIPNPPAAVPEASTIMAGALMLLPLGIGAIRTLRKERIA